MLRVYKLAHIYHVHEYFTFNTRTVAHREDATLRAFSVTPRGRERLLETRTAASLLVVSC